MFTPSVNIDAFGSVQNPSVLIIFDIIVDAAADAWGKWCNWNQSLSSIDASVNVRVTVDSRCKYTLRENDTAFIMTQLKNCMALRTHIFSERIFIKSQTNSHFSEIFQVWRLSHVLQYLWYSIKMLFFSIWKLLSFPL